MSNDRLTLSQIALLVAYTIGMAGGQILFKLAAVHLNGTGVAARLLSLTHNLYFVSALVLYGALSLLWVWILTFTPLSRAYPFVALAFALTPALGAWLFGEPVSFRLILGISLILCGLFLVVG
jgi:drug/metabolite transporter (DMT)-like permease